MTDRTQDEKTLLINFGNHLRNLRLSKGYTQEELAFKAGFSRSYYTEIETGKRNIALLNLYRLAECLGVKLTEVVDFTDG